MIDNSPIRRVAAAAAKWYMPFNRQLLADCELRPLLREADSSDEVTIGFTPTIAFPSALDPKTVLGKHPFGLKGLFFSPLVVRLHYVAQLSTTSLRANIDAKHCRLSHALGTLCILSSFLEILTTRMMADKKIDPCCYPRDEEIIGAFTYSALHDAFQGPFGHALDAVREELVGGLHANRRLDKTLLNFIVGSALNLQEHGPQEGFPTPPIAIRRLCEIMQETIAKPYGIDLVRLLRWVHDASLPDFSSLDEESRKRRQHIGWLYELIEGPIDADRWDYLWRDTLHLGFTRDNNTLSDLLRDFRDDITVHWDGVRSRLMVSESVARRLGSSFFSLRKNLYKNVYENPEKRVVDGILIRCIHLGLLAETTRSELWTHDREYVEFLVNLVHITDAELLSILEQVRNPMLAHLARELRTYPAVRAFWSEVLREEEFKSVLSFQKGKLEAFNYRGMRPPDWATAPSDEDDEDISQRDKVIWALEETDRRLQARTGGSTVRSIGEPYLPSLLLHCSIMPKRPARVLQFERVVWKMVVWQLRDSDIIKNICRSVRETLAGTGAFGVEISDDTVATMLEDCPPLFISFPWIPSFVEAAMQEMSREPSSSKICVRSSDGKVIHERAPADLMLRTVESETYVAIAGYPLLITNDLNENQREMLETTATWAVRNMISYGCCLALPRELVTPRCDTHILNYLRAKTDEGRS